MLPFFLLGEWGDAKLQKQHAHHRNFCPANEAPHCVMNSIFLDSEDRSPSASLFVQGISTRIPRQDMGSAVHQGG
jgi:hypothetical protein